MSRIPADHPVRRFSFPGGAAVLLAVLSLMCARENHRPIQTATETPAVPSSGGPQPSAPPEATIAGPDESTRADRVMADKADDPPGNTACTACHKNLQREMISRTHERKAVFCAECHGSSAAHRAGGSPQPKPDIIIARSDIDALCGKCHRPHSRSMIERTVRKWEGRPRPNGRMATIESVCTDCHGTHLLDN